MVDPNNWRILTFDGPDGEIITAEEVKDAKTGFLYAPYVPIYKSPVFIEQFGGQETSVTIGETPEAKIPW